MDQRDVSADATAGRGATWVYEEDPRSWTHRDATVAVARRLREVVRELRRIGDLLERLVRHQTGGVR